MKIPMMIVMTLALATVFGCMSPRGGGLSGEGFKISVPTLATEVKQGELQTVPVSLHREQNFKRDVKMEFKGSDGIGVEPTDALVKGSDPAVVQLRITANTDTNLGDYRVYVRGTPETGEPTSTEFTVKVVAP